MKLQSILLLGASLPLAASSHAQSLEDVVPPDAYIVTVTNTASGSPSVVRIYRDGSRVVVDRFDSPSATGPTAGRMRTLYNFDDHTAASWRYPFDAAGCASSAIPVEWGDPFALYGSLTGQGSRAVGKERLQGMSTVIYDTPMGANGTMKAWIQAGTGLVFKEQLTGPAGDAKTVLEVNDVNFTPPSTTTFTLPPNCTPVAQDDAADAPTTTVVKMTPPAAPVIYVGYETAPARLGPAPAGPTLADIHANSKVPVVKVGSDANATQPAPAQATTAPAPKPAAHAPAAAPQPTASAQAPVPPSPAPTTSAPATAATDTASAAPSPVLPTPHSAPPAPVVPPTQTASAPVPASASPTPAPSAASTAANVPAPAATNFAPAPASKSASAPASAPASQATEMAAASIPAPPTASAPAPAPASAASAPAPAPTETNTVASAPAPQPPTAQPDASAATPSVAVNTDAIPGDWVTGAAHKSASAAVVPGSRDDCSVVLRVVKADTMEPITSGVQVGISAESGVEAFLRSSGHNAAESSVSPQSMHEVLPSIKDGMFRIGHVPSQFTLETSFGSAGSIRTTVYLECYAPETTLLLVVKNPAHIADGAEFLWVKASQVASNPK